MAEALKSSRYQIDNSYMKLHEDLDDVIKKMKVTKAEMNKLRVNAALLAVDQSIMHNPELEVTLQACTKANEDLARLITSYQPVPNLPSPTPPLPPRPLSAPSSSQYEEGMEGGVEGGSEETAEGMRVGGQEETATEEGWKPVTEDNQQMNEISMEVDQVDAGTKESEETMGMEQVGEYEEQAEGEELEGREEEENNPMEEVKLKGAEDIEEPDGREEEANNPMEEVKQKGADNIEEPEPMDNAEIGKQDLEETHPPDPALLPQTLPLPPQDGSSGNALLSPLLTQAPEDEGNPVLPVEVRKASEVYSEVEGEP